MLAHFSENRNGSKNALRKNQERRIFMEEETVWFDREGDFLEVSSAPERKGHFAGVIL